MRTVNIKQNTSNWCVCTNRYTTTRGFYWGWIEGASHNETWSNDPGSDFTSSDASRIVTEHNAWLEEIRPVELKIIEEKNALSAISKQIAELEPRLNDLYSKRNACMAKIEAWTAQDAARPEQQGRSDA